ncbi:MAG: hypothetical protein NC037_02555 [Bacteroides sp.]|nr:hypothetical protein [Bacillota bacterium]MCM1393408.1 hypothetical protein [[Eubacterium] siraeum]MCM1455394.1 hypothetical protein [Bacteroides sp.]
MEKIKNPMSKRRKIILIISVVLVAIIVALLVSYAVYSYLDKGSADDYTLDEHIERISALVEQRYFSELSEYTGYELYPIYDSNEELRYFLIELKPVGFVYVRLNKSYSKITSRHFDVAGMYTRCEGEPWSRYRIWWQGVVEDEDGNYVRNLPYPDGGWHYKENSLQHQYYYEINASGDFVVNEYSHFKAAHVEDEKRYILLCNDNYVPAIKKDGQFINLVSMEELHSDGDEYPHIQLSFINKGYFNL